MSQTSPATPRVELLHSLSATLQTTPVMKRLHDPDHTLSDETARQLVESLEYLGITMTMTAGTPAARGLSALNSSSAHPTDAEREIEQMRQEQDDDLDEALKETFPASDPIAPGHPHPSKPG